MKSLSTITVLILSITLFSSCTKDAYQSEIGKVMTLSDDTYAINPIGQNLTTTITLCSTNFINAEKERVLNEASDSNNSSGRVEVLNVAITDIFIKDRSDLNTANSEDLGNLVESFDLILVDPLGIGPVQLVASSDSFGELEITDAELLDYSNKYSSSEIRLLVTYRSSLTDIAHAQVRCLAKLNFLYISE